MFLFGIEAEPRFAMELDVGLSRNGGYCGGSRNGRGVRRAQSDEPIVEYAGQICSWGTEGSGEIGTAATNQKKRGTNEDWPSTQGVHGAIRFAERTATQPVELVLSQNPLKGYNPVFS